MLNGANFKCTSRLALSMSTLLRVNEFPVLLLMITAAIIDQSTSTTFIHGIHRLAVFSASNPPALGFIRTNLGSHWYLLVFNSLPITQDPNHRGKRRLEIQHLSKNNSFSHRFLCLFCQISNRAYFNSVRISSRTFHSLFLQFPLPNGVQIVITALSVQCPDIIVESDCKQASEAAASRLIYKTSTMLLNCH